MSSHLVEILTQESPHNLLKNLGPLFEYANAAKARPNGNKIGILILQFMLKIRWDGQKKHLALKIAASL